MLLVFFFFKFNNILFIAFAFVTFLNWQVIGFPLKEYCNKASSKQNNQVKIWIDLKEKIN